MGRKIGFTRVALLLGLVFAVGGVHGLAAQASSVDASEGREYIGEWAVTLATPDGELPMTISVADVQGKVAIRLGGPQGQALEQVTKNGTDLVGRSTVNYQGMDLPMVLTLSRDGENLKASWIFADGAYSTEATARRAQ